MALKNIKVVKNADGTISLTFDPTLVMGKSNGKAGSDIVSRRVASRISTALFRQASSSTSAASRSKHDA